MNAPIKPQTCPKNTSYCKFGSETLLKLLSLFESQIKGVIEDKDVECVHKSRVTSRRLRAVLPLFRYCASGKEYNEWTKQLKKTTRLLAEARDLDVQIAFVKQYMKRLKSTSEQASMEVLLEDLKEKRKNIQPSVVDGLEQLEKSEILWDIRRFSEKTVAGQPDAFGCRPVLEKAR